MLSKTKINWAIDQMIEEFPDALGSLHSDTPFHLLVAVILSAQATDVSVNKVTPRLFAKFPDAKAMAAADVLEIEKYIKSIGLYHNKAKHLKACSQEIMNRFNGVVPDNRKDLMSLPGVGRKTANVVLGDAFSKPAFAVDTHITRISKRLRIVKQSANVRDIENVLTDAIPKDKWIRTHHTMILFGRNQCMARNPKCITCPVLSICAEGQKRVKIKSESE